MAPALGLVMTLVMHRGDAGERGVPDARGAHGVLREGPAAPFERLAAFDPWLSAQVAPASDGWIGNDATGELVVSQQYALGGLSGIATKAPHHADGARWVGLGRSRRYGISLTLERATHRAAELDRGRLVYHDALASTDVLLSTNPFAFDEAWLLKDPTAPTRFSWRVEPGEGVRSARTTPGGGLTFEDGIGRGILEIPPPFAVDSRGTRRAAALSWDGHHVEVTLDTQGLQYPVLLDPGLVEVATWTLRTATSFSRGRAGASVAYDPSVGSTILFGGFSQTPGLGLLIDNLVWTWDGMAWLDTPTQGTPPVARGLGQFVYTPGLGGIFAWGGHDVAADVSGPATPKVLYSNPAFTWGDPTIAGSVPAGRSGHAMVYTGVLSEILGVGGGPRMSPGAALPDRVGIASMNPAVWTGVGEVGYTPARDRAVVYMPPMNGLPRRLIAMGGRTCIQDTVTAPCDAPVASQMLEIGAASWIGTPTTGEPLPPRWGASAVFDPNRSRAVFFGGRDASGPGPDTYEFTGARWYRRQIPGPSPRSFAAMTYIPSAGESLLVGGATGVLEVDDPQNTSYSNETWSYKVTSAACTTDVECDTGHCVDGACCEVAACGPCETCNAPMEPGYCIPVVGEADPDTCSSQCLPGGVCEGSQGLACAGPGECTVGASAGQCVDGVCCATAECDVCATCNGETPGICAPIVSGTDPDSCMTECNAQGLCAGFPQGHSCDTPGDCTSGHCTIGICCDTECSGACAGCETGTCLPVSLGQGPSTSCGGFLCDGMGQDCPADCSVGGCESGPCGPGGKCAQSQGMPCQAADECETTFCVDGFCCISSCDNACVTCSGPLGDGVCQPVAAGETDPLCDPNYACTGDGGGCSTNCLTDAECAPASACNQLDHKCEPGRRKAVEDVARTNPSSVCAPPRIRNAHDVCVDDPGSFDAASPKGCLCASPGAPGSSIPSPLAPLVLPLVAFARSRRKRNASTGRMGCTGGMGTTTTASMTRGAGVTFVVVLTMSFPFSQACSKYEVPADEPCRNAGFSMASRVQGCTGDAEHANHLYDAFHASYVCLVPDANILDFVCSDEILKLPCAQVSANGDDLAKWFSSPDCKKILDQRGTSIARASDNPVCLQIYDYARHEVKVCLEPGQSEDDFVPTLSDFDATYTCLAPLQPGDSTGKPISSCANDLIKPPCGDRAFDDWITDTPSCASVITKKKGAGAP